MAGRLGRRLWIRLGLAGLLAALVGLTTPGEVPATPEVPTPGRLAAEDLTMKQTEVDALVSARTSGHAVEVGAFRSERRDVWANPDGTFTEYSHMQPVRTKKNNRWVTPDASLERRPDGSVGPRAATYGLRLSGGGTGPMLTAERAGRSMSLSWPAGPLPAPVIAGDTATYPEVAPGLDLVINVGVETFSHVLVVKTAEAARRPEVRGLTLGLAGKGITVRMADEGRLHAVDTATGGRVFEAPAPIMWDTGDPQAEARIAAGMGDEPVAATRAAPKTAKRTDLGVRVADGRLHLTPAPSMLDDPATRWPVYIDPVWQATTTTFWTMVDSGFPTTEYPKFGGFQTDKDNERVGLCEPDPDCDGSGVKRVMYRLPTSYSGKVVLSAEFQITLLRGWTTDARNIMLYRLGADITSATNWSNQPGWSQHQQTRSLGGGLSCTSGVRNAVFNATEAAQFAAANSRSSVVFGLRAENEGNNQHSKRFCENALLKVNWNRAPSKPAAADLQLSPGGACVFGTTRPFTDTRPILKATLRDPDHLAVALDAENLLAEFRVQWTPPGGSLQTVTWQSPYQVSGTPFGWAYNTSALTFPQNVTISWDVRAFDSVTWGAWSSDSTSNVCEFVYDNTTPTPPRVSSPEFLDDQLVDCATYSDATWRDGVGVHTTFTFDSDATDVVEYQYGINTNPFPGNILRPTSDGGPVQLAWLAAIEGPNFVTVQAVDRASKHSAIAMCNFRVAAGRPAIAEWSLADVDNGDGTEAGDSRGNAPATEFGNVTFGVEGPGGQADRAIRLPGTSDSYLSTSTAGLIDTSKSFAVSAWVKLSNNTQNQVVVSQDGSGEPGFVLGFDAASGGKWTFMVPLNDVDTFGAWKAIGGTPQVGVWTHLVGVFSAQASTLSLYVDGQAPIVGTRRSTWTSRGAIRIGHKMAKSGYTEHYSGDVADVAVFNRIVVPAEVAQLRQLKPARIGYWPLNTASGGVSPDCGDGPTCTGPLGLTLTNGATITVEDPFGDPPVIPMMGVGELYLDGVNDHATTASQAVATNGSFSVAARVRLASPDIGPAMTVLSQKGSTHDSGFIIRRNTINRWELALPQADVAGGLVDTAFDDQAPPTGEQQGQLLVLVYNAFTNEAVLYVDGQLAASAKVIHSLAWNATGGLQVGHAFIDGVWREYLAGSVDEVRVYAGALDQTTVQQLNQLIELPDM